MTENLPANEPASSSLVTVREEFELQVAQTQALKEIGQSLNSLAKFITGGGLQTLLGGYARSQSVTAMLGGLTTHAGRNGLDARVLGQNAIEIVEQIEKVFDKYQERLSAKAKGEARDPEVNDSEADFVKWVKKQEERERNDG